MVRWGLPSGELVNQGYLLRVHHSSRVPEARSTWMVSDDTPTAVNASSCSCASCSKVDTRAYP